MQKSFLADVIWRFSIACQTVCIAFTLKIYCPSNFGDMFKCNLKYDIRAQCMCEATRLQYLHIYIYICKLKISITYHGLFHLIEPVVQRVR